MATLTAQSVNSRTPVDLAGVAPTAGTGDEFPNTGYERLHVHNPEASDCNITVDSLQMVDGLAVPDKVITITAGKTMIVGPFPTAVYRSASTGRTKITCALAGAGTLANVRLAVVKFA